MHALYTEFRKPWSLDHSSVILFGLGGLALVSLVLGVCIDMLRAL